MLHYIAQRLIHAFLIKKSFFAFTDFESRHVYAEVKQYAKGPLNRRVIVPFSHGSKATSDPIFASRVITKKLCSINFQSPAFSKLFP